ncbi:hypothetical protein Lalb_Chr16g0387361 [Lupinus albus]|uniref:Uncharacterized protein n=1 Tax=Lupinus albus TaxID=3870 RepID=A0A6A4PDC7_LUPAL|nr:hypothetical protein Lalb_Chr16g0387361 [Lupinus albus]
MEVTQWSEQGNPGSTSDGVGRVEGRDPIGFTLWSQPPAALRDFDSSSGTRRDNKMMNENEKDDI